MSRYSTFLLAAIRILTSYIVLVSCHIATTATTTTTAITATTATTGTTATITATYLQ